MQSTFQEVSLEEIQIGNLLITHTSRGETPISPTEETLERITARDLIYAQNHVNIPRFISRKDKTIKKISPYQKEKKDPPRILLNRAIMIKESVIVMPASSPHSYLFVRNYPDHSFSPLQRPTVKKMRKILTTTSKAQDYFLKEREYTPYFLQAEIEQQKPLEERLMYFLNDPSPHIPLITNNESTDLAKWLFQDQLNTVKILLQKHNHHQLLFYGVEKNIRSSDLPFIRFLWMTPINDERDPPKNDIPIIGSYRFGCDYFYASQSPKLLQQARAQDLTASLKYQNPTLPSSHQPQQSLHEISQDQNSTPIPSHFPEGHFPHCIPKSLAR